jgi:hypothetical protein
VFELATQYMNALRATWPVSRCAAIEREPLDRHDARALLEPSNLNSSGAPKSVRRGRSSRVHSAGANLAGRKGYCGTRYTDRVADVPTFGRAKSAGARLAGRRNRTSECRTRQGATTVGVAVDSKPARAPRDRSQRLSQAILDRTGIAQRLRTGSALTRVIGFFLRASLQTFLLARHVRAVAASVNRTLRVRIDARSFSLRCAATSVDNRGDGG